MIGDHWVEAHQLNLHINQQRSLSQPWAVVGHISGVDPTTNRIKVVIPTWTNDNQNYMESGWIPLGTMVAGNQYGIQLLPFGQASVTDVTGEDSAENGNTPMAEQVLVHVLGTKRGLYIQSVQLFNQQDVPPSGYNDPSGVKANAGEWLFKHSTGGYLYFANANEITLHSLTNPAPVVQTDKTPDDCTQTVNILTTAAGANTNTNNDNVKTATSTINITSDSKGADESSDSNINVTAQNPDAEDTAMNSTAVSLSSEVTKGSVGQADLNLKASSKGATVDNSSFTLETETESTGTATGTINVNASELGAGTLDINVKGLTADVNITLAGETNVMTITVTNGLINVICAEANVTAETSATVESPLVNVESAHITLGTGTASNLLNQFSALVYNVHTHEAPGGITSGPSELIEPISSCQNVFGS